MANLKATQMFIDRVPARTAYYALVKYAVREDFRNRYVINFYGDGGESKTELRKKLWDEVLGSVAENEGSEQIDSSEGMAELRKLRDEVQKLVKEDKKNKQIVLKLDFDKIMPVDKVVALNKLADQLRKDVPFPLFDRALRRLYEMGHKMQQPSTASEPAFFDSHPGVDAATEIATMVSGLGKLGTIKKAAINGPKVFYSLKKLSSGEQAKRIFKDELEEIEEAEEKDLQKKLPLWFAKDVNA